jgi:hypothetical protein
LGIGFEATDFGAGLAADLVDFGAPAEVVDFFSAGAARRAAAVEGSEADSGSSRSAPR